jgi:hypothetical protein
MSLAAVEFQFVLVKSQALMSASDLCVSQYSVSLIIPSPFTTTDLCKYAAYTHLFCIRHKRNVNKWRIADAHCQRHILDL